MQLVCGAWCVEGALPANWAEWPWRGVVCSAMSLHPPQVSPSIGGTHLHRQALEQGPIVLAGTPPVSSSSFACQLLEDGARVAMEVAYQAHLKQS